MAARPRPRTGSAGESSDDPESEIKHQRPCNVSEVVSCAPVRAGCPVDRQRGTHGPTSTHAARVGGGGREGRRHGLQLACARPWGPDLAGTAGGHRVVHCRGSTVEWHGGVEPQQGQRRKSWDTGIGWGVQSTPGGRVRWVGKWPETSTRGHRAPVPRSLSPSPEPAPNTKQGARAAWEQPRAFCYLTGPAGPRQR